MAPRPRTVSRVAAPVTVLEATIRLPVALPAWRVHAARMATGSAAKRHRAHDAITIGDEMKRCATAHRIAFVRDPRADRTPNRALACVRRARYEEEACSSIVDLQRPCVVRLDGHCFHTYTKGFRRPYDLRIHEAMVATATDLLERFGAVTAYTESDEISLLFPPSTAESPSLPFSGRDAPR